MENMLYDKVNGDVAFIDSTHKYFNLKNPDINYISVTTLIGKYHEEFDEDFWSSYKALEKLMGAEFQSLGIKKNLLQLKKFKIDVTDLGIDKDLFIETKEEILAEYENARKVACERGTAMHKIKEDQYYTKDNHNVINLIGKDCEFYCKQNDFTLDKDQAIYPEFLIYYHHPKGYLNIAGQVDLLIKDGNDIYIDDYKTNVKGIESKAYFNPITKQTKKMYHPISNIEDTVLMHYTLQLSLYAYMLQQINPEFNIRRLRLIHLDDDMNEKIIELEYKKEDVERLLAFQFRKSKTEYERKKVDFDFLIDNAN